MSFAWLPVGLLAAFLLWEYGVAPLLLLLDRGRPATAPRLAFVRIASLLPMDLEQAFAHQEPPLRHLGFEPLPPIRDARDAGQVRAGRSGVTQLFRHPAHGDLAILLSALRHDEPPVTALTFETALADGTTLVTSNAPVAPARPLPPTWRAARFPRERDAARLHALHRARLAGLEPAAPVPLDDAPAWVRARDQASLDWSLACGYGRRAGDMVKYSARGAYGTVLRAKLPWSWVERRAGERERKRLLAAAGLG